MTFLIFQYIFIPNQANNVSVACASLQSN